MPVIVHPERRLDAEVEDACSLAAPFPSQLTKVASAPWILSTNETGLYHL